MNQRTIQYSDSPEPGELMQAILRWQKPARLEKLSEKAVIDWLYDFIRLNVKRGRVFDLREVLKTGRADCLGYAKLFSTLGIRWGLDLGVVEVVIDNRSRIMPHVATLVKLAHGTPQCVDFWYGCRNIRHQRLGLNVKKNGRWRIEDIDFTALNEAEDISYLPDHCVDAITLYIQGNRSLKEENYPEAIEHYTGSIRLYPDNARVYYNRAIAYEKMGQVDKSQADYVRALRDDSSIIRTLATQPAEVIDLIRLDEENMPEPEQQDYLRRHGFQEGCSSEF